MKHRYSIPETLMAVLLLAILTSVCVGLLGHLHDARLREEQRFHCLMVLDNTLELLGAEAGTPEALLAAQWAEAAFPGKARYAPTVEHEGTTTRLVIRDRRQVALASVELGP